MRITWLGVVVVGVLGCQVESPRPQPDYDWPPYITPDGGPNDGRCHADSECGAAVCARNGECLPATLVHAVRITWTVGGEPASAVSCATLGDLAIEFVAGDGFDSSGYAPVPCDAGIFSIDKFPTRYTSVRLGPLDFGSGVETFIDATGAAALDLPY